MKQSRKEGQNEGHTDNEPRLQIKFQEYPLLAFSRVNAIVALDLFAVGYGNEVIQGGTDYKSNQNAN